MNRWRVDVWDGSPWAVTRNTCAYCGYTFTYFRVRGVFIAAQKRREAHEAVCVTQPLRCPHSFGEAQCILASGHPTGREYDWFTSTDGHVWEKAGE